MKISITDKGSGIAYQFAKAIGATVKGRFINIPRKKGAGFITGFSWGKELRMMIRNYHLNEPVQIARKNELEEGQDDLVFLMSGIFPSIANPDEPLQPERANILICKHAVSSVMDMPSNTLFASITIAVAKQRLTGMFGHIDHPVVKSVLQAKDNFVMETGISSSMISIAGEMLQASIPENLESIYYKLKCEELLCLIFSTLMQRDELPAGNMHIEDIRAIYAVKTKLQSHPDEPPNISQLAKLAGMSEPKLRKLFKQTFGKGVFEFYQYTRMQEAARLLKEGKLNVSEVGYQLGFTNLSHFSRVFEEYIGIKPKRYALG